MEHGPREGDDVARARPVAPRHGDRGAALADREDPRLRGDADEPRGSRRRVRCGGHDARDQRAVAVAVRGPRGARPDEVPAVEEPPGQAWVRRDPGVDDGDRLAGAPAPAPRVGDPQPVLGPRPRGRPVRRTAQRGHARDPLRGPGQRGGCRVEPGEQRRVGGRRGGHRGRRRRRGEHGEDDPEQHPHRPPAPGHGGERRTRGPSAGAVPHSPRRGRIEVTAGTDVDLRGSNGGHRDAITSERVARALRLGTCPDR